MKRILSIVVGIVAVASVIYSFIGNQESPNILGFEVNIWTYRGFWSLVIAGIISEFFEKKEDEN